MFEERMTRRDALKKAAYITPVDFNFFGCAFFCFWGFWNK